MNQRASVVIIGAGIIGASIAYHLTERGCRDIIMLEQAETEITGSTARSAAGVRHQFSTEVNIRLSQYGVARIRAFAAEVGVDPGFQAIGYCFLVSDPANWAAYQRATALQRHLGVPTELLDPGDIARLIPGVATDDLLGATYCAADGHCDPHSVALGYLTRARERGMRLWRATPATGLGTVGGAVQAVHTPAGTISCDVVINAAGSWAGEVAALAGLDVPVRPFRRCIYVADPPAELSGRLPLTIDVASGFYLRPEGGQLIFGMSNHAEPSSHALHVDWDWLATVLDAGLARFPPLERARLHDDRCWAGSYEITPDHNPILGRHPALAGYIDASGFSGHGISHAPATGMLIAEELLDGRAHTIDIDPLRITRFADGGSDETHIV
jgi:sarcosine oxidase subunit beta